MENPIKIHDLGVPLFLETPIYSITLGTKKTHAPCMAYLPTNLP